MTLYKIHFQSPILVDSYGSPFGMPILLIENILSKVPPSTSLANTLSKSYSLTHIKRIEFHNIESSEYSSIHSILTSIEDILLSLSSKVILISEGHSSALSLQICNYYPEKIHIAYLVNPDFLFPMNEEFNPLKDFWDWFSKRDDFFLLLPKFPFVLDFYFKFLKFEELMARQTSENNLHFILTNRTPNSGFEVVRNIGKKVNISILENIPKDSILDTPVVCKMINWFLEKDNLQILKD